jgi:hypothetical protein
VGILAKINSPSFSFVDFQISFYVLNVGYNIEFEFDVKDKRFVSSIKVAMLLLSANGDSLIFIWSILKENWPQSDKTTV